MDNEKWSSEGARAALGKITEKALDDGGRGEKVQEKFREKIADPRLSNDNLQKLRDVLDELVADEKDKRNWWVELNKNNPWVTDVIRVLASTGGAFPAAGLLYDPSTTTLSVSADIFKKMINDEMGRRKQESA